MHISEGVLSGGALIAGWAGTVAGVSVGLYELKTDKIVRTALISSAFFLASLVNIRLGPSSTHLSLLAPVGLILGWSAFPAMMIALLLQALLFHFGGFLVLGANTLAMAMPSVIVYLLFGRLIRESNNRVLVMSVSFIAGALAVMLGALIVAGFLSITDENFIAASKLLFLAHVPLALIEGAVTAFMVSFLKRVSPEFLQ